MLNSYSYMTFGGHSSSICILAHYYLTWNAIESVAKLVKVQKTIKGKSTSMIPNRVVKYHLWCKLLNLSCIKAVAHFENLDIYFSFKNFFLRLDKLSRMDKKYNRYKAALRTYLSAKKGFKIPTIFSADKKLFAV